MGTPTNPPPHRPQPPPLRWQPAPPQPGGVPPQPYSPQQHPPPQAYPQQFGYGWAPPGAPQLKKQRRWWIRVPATLFAFAVLIGGCGFLIFKKSTAPVDHANKVLALLEDGEVQEATSLFNSRCFTDDDIDEIEEFFTANPVTDYDLTGVGSSRRDTRSASGSVALADGLGDRPISIELTQRGNQISQGWQVCNIEIAEP